MKLFANIVILFGKMRGSNSKTFHECKWFQRPLSRRKIQLKSENQEPSETFSYLKKYEKPQLYQQHQLKFSVRFSKNVKTAGSKLKVYAEY